MIACMLHASDVGLVYRSVVQVDCMRFMICDDARLCSAVARLQHSAGLTIIPAVTLLMVHRRAEKVHQGHQDGVCRNQEGR
jgi:hypothetical protein